eukprot:5385133-Amphidinium_carterae.1
MERTMRSSRQREVLKSSRGSRKRMEPTSTPATQAAAVALRQALGPGQESATTQASCGCNRIFQQENSPRPHDSRFHSTEATPVEPPESAIIALLGEVLRENAALTVAVEGIMRRMVSLEQSVHVVQNGHNGCNGVREEPTTNLAKACASPPHLSAIPLPFAEQQGDSPSVPQPKLSERYCEMAVQCTNPHWAQDFAVLSGILGDG